MKPILQRVVRSIIWMVCGVLVIIIRTLILPNASIVVWEVLGSGMIAYGAAKLLWVLARGATAKPSIP